MTEAIFRKSNGALLAKEERALDVLSRIKNDRDVVVDVFSQRNPDHDRLFFAILKFSVMHGVSPDGETLFVGEQAARTALKVATGEVDPVIDAVTGKTFFVVRSQSRRAMDGTRFSEYFDRCIDVLTTRWLPKGTDPDEVRREIRAMADGPMMAGIEDHRR